MRHEGNIDVVDTELNEVLTSVPLVRADSVRLASGERTGTITSAANAALEDIAAPSSQPGTAIQEERR
jgi:hypothetical protein